MIVDAQTVQQKTLQSLLNIKLRVQNYQPEAYWQGIVGGMSLEKRSNCV